jgi:hypothetical protein
MSRFVQAKPRELSAKLASENRPNSAVKDYTERIAKYVPAEILAAFTAINGLFANSEDNLEFWALLIITAGLWIITPFYFKWIKKPEDEPSLKKQQWVSFFAFIIWAYTISAGNGIFGNDGFNIYHSEVGAAIMIIFSLISGAIIPRT